jgi:hypothetical protein
MKIARHRKAAERAPTQVLRPSFYIDKDVIRPPLGQRVPAKIKSNTDAKAVSEAAAKAVRHGNDPMSGLLGYDAETWADIHERNAKGLRTRPQALANLDDKARARDKNRRRWQAIADTVWKNEPDLTKRDAAKMVAGKTGGSWRWIERHISKKSKSKK